MNSNASHGAKRLACNVIVYNYLASNNFIEVASEFRGSNNIPQKVLDSFKTLTLEGVIRHTIKNPTKLNIEAKTSNKGNRDKQFELNKDTKSESEKLIKNKSDQLNFETYSRSESKKPSESGQAMLKSKRKFQDEKLAKSDNHLFKLNRCSKAESEKVNFTTKPNSASSSNFEKLNKIDNDLSKSKPTSRYDNDSVMTKLNITSSSNFEKLNKRDNDLSKSKPTSSCDKENLKESNILKSTITPRSNFGKLNKTDSNTLNFVSKSNTEKRTQNYNKDSDNEKLPKNNMSHSTSKPRGTISSPVQPSVSKQKPSQQNQNVPSQLHPSVLKRKLILQSQFEPSTSKKARTDSKVNLSQENRDMCDHIVIDYLERNGYLEISNDLKASIQLDMQTKQNLISLESLVSFEKPELITSSSETPLDSWANILDGFAHLKDHLDPNNSTSEVDKVVKYILDLNIAIRYLNVKFSSNCRKIRYLDEFKTAKKKYPNFAFGQFSKGIFSEDSKIHENWDTLVKEAGIRDPLKCISDFKTLPPKARLTILRQNVLGCFLGQDLPSLRHASDVLFRGFTIIPPWNEGKFSEDDDKIIIREVEKCGANFEAWHKLAKILNRFNPKAIARRYELIKRGKVRSGRWTDDEFDIMLRYIFTHPNAENNPNFLKSLPIAIFDKVGALLNRLPDNVYRNWFHHVRPILLSHMSGTLHTDWRRLFLKYIVERELNTPQEIDWDDAKRHFPCQSQSALTSAYHPCLKNQTLQIPFYILVRNQLQRSKHSTERKSFIEHREMIVHLYDKIIKELRLKK